MSNEEYEAMLDAEVCMFVRRAAVEITGGNCAFIDDDIAILTHLARRAVEAGLTDKLHPRVQSRIAAQAIEAQRAETGTGSVEDESAVAKPCAQG